MSKVTLIIFSLIIVIMGVLGLTGMEMATEPSWHAWLKIIIGVIGLIIGFADKGKKTTA
ncbi:MAG: hypothetical protein ACP5D6_11070 [Kosmotogaceae bacterium]